MQNLEDRTLVRGVATKLRAFIRSADGKKGRTPADLGVRRLPSTESNASRRIDDPEIEYRLACSRSDFLGAFELLQTRYLEAGLADCTAGACRIRMMPYHRWEQSQVFVAEAQERIVGTVTLVRDGRYDLPICDNYEREILAAREIGRVGEITSLAVDPVHPKPAEVFGQLTRILTFYARYHGMDFLAATVHPRHAKFYQHAMGFQVIGDEVQCRQVCGNPGVAVLGAVNDRSKYRRRWQDYYFDGVFPRSEMHPRPITADEHSYCHSLVDQANLYAKSTAGMGV
ncbi:N-acyl amino acid synthase FeeM domain-containing protein [Allorhodopirellula heiligendammensis]|uniref:N-acetyltransferase domain-containing protein n=1 Tax=Allorhodopirellula heiligendammensis TaxID=2714739 RepID=A0A5C6C969_9BACT|nr:hypothetical protein [Allorhodopirellula heiligendammensis]TWU19981.1 hypothetical protein Poly21_21600 [Allorhodopirellula heiligendammensis]